ncbi:efflux RND transporter periplasmic adaptor subunit [Vibrio sp. TH_r3]|uniref:efflux RND transporter periplasmic adaptor subunit n=1 Tax=Vibrio sp. TH_r3 TaxID=3082084 RepID=UPI00295434B3|nr:efflux RND transporter periplasmic adaptor subunit [Vibrio sp. TH_r3]MDV7103786.1 efflux RND transporter periplasmic adaptor subunit [Vibrio sp. TH_r3]
MSNKAFLLVITSLTILSGCDGQPTGQSQSFAPLVSAENVKVISYHRNQDYVGRINAVEDVTITAQVSGYLRSRHFVEGQMVEQGQLLFEIEPSSYQAQVASANASVALAQANVKKTTLDYERGKNLLPKGNISQSEYDALTSAKLGAEAQLQAAKAELNAAEVNLSYTSIRAPFDGRVSESYVSIGDLVSPSTGTLTNIVSLDPIHASFTVSERQRLLMGMEEIDGSGTGAADKVEVQLIFENGESYGEMGHIDFIDNRINTTTGTLAMRAQFKNPKEVLLPGQHVKVNIQEKTTVELDTIPRRAVQSDLQGDFVMLLTEDNIAERRNVKLGKQTETGAIIVDGLNSDDRVITKGLQRIRNGVEVRVEQDSKTINVAGEEM